jgi:hypothetical protein
MAKKRNSSEPVVSTGAAPARKKTAPPRAKHSLSAPVDPPAAAESSPSASLALVVSGPSYDEIAQLAYSYWVKRGCEGGSPEEDWLRAEQELRNRVSTLATA